VPKHERLAYAPVETIMPNGKSGDHPLTDILIHGMSVYSEEIDALISEIVDLGGRSEIEPMLMGEHRMSGNPDLPRLEAELVSIHERLRSEAKERGWEVS